MTEQKYGTIKIPRDSYEHHNKRRKELGISWEEYLNKESVTVNDPVDYTEIREVVRDELRQLNGGMR
jgi:hypothetical protein